MGSRPKALEKLADYLRGRLQGAEKSEFERIMKDDAQLREFIEAAGEVRRESLSSGWSDLREPAHTLLGRMLHDLKAARKPGGRKRAVLIFDSKLMPVPEGVRPAEVDTRRLRYRLGQGLLELSAYPVSPNSFELIGRLVGGEATADLLVQLRSTGHKAAATGDEFGLFRFPRIPSGKYELRLSHGRDFIAVAKLEL